MLQPPWRSPWKPALTLRKEGIGNPRQGHSSGVLVPRLTLTLSLPLHHSKIRSPNSQATAYLQISSDFPLASGLKELFPIGLWGEGVNIDQSWWGHFICEGNRCEPQVLRASGGQLPCWGNHGLAQLALGKDGKRQIRMGLEKKRKKLPITS